MIVDDAGLARGPFRLGLLPFLALLSRSCVFALLGALVALGAVASCTTDAVVARDVRRSSEVSAPSSRGASGRAPHRSCPRHALAPHAHFGA